MDSSASDLYEPRDVLHPGETVLEYLDFNAWSQNDLARRTGLTPKTISEICNGKAPITPSTSIALEKVFQRPAHLWLNLQRQYDEATARRRSRAQSAEWRDWAAAFPLAEMRKQKWIKSKGIESDVDALLAFLGVSSPASFESVWGASHVAYRQTQAFKASMESTAVWVRATEHAASMLNVASFDEGLLRSSIGVLRRHTTMRADKIIEPVQAICAAAGVAVVWVPELKHMGISGCARWMTSTRALIALTLRYKTDDQMWFTFFHELGHILLHRKTCSFVIDNDDESLSDGMVDPQMQQREDEANRFAADTLIPPDALAMFVEINDFGNESILQFAEDIGVGPGLVVGRLQHEKLLKPYQGNAFKQNLGFEIGEQD